MGAEKCLSCEFWPGSLDNMCSMTEEFPRQLYLERCAAYSSVNKPTIPADELDWNELKALMKKDMRIL